MNIYLITQETNIGYDTFDSAVVIADNEEQASKVNPLSVTYPKDNNISDTEEDGTFIKRSSSWARNAKDVKVKLLGSYLGEEKRAVAIVSSYNAG